MEELHAQMSVMQVPVEAALGAQAKVSGHFVRAHAEYFFDRNMVLYLQFQSACVTIESALLFSLCVVSCLVFARCRTAVQHWGTPRQAHEHSGAVKTA